MNQSINEKRINEAKEVQLINERTLAGAVGPLTRMSGGTVRTGRVGS